MLVEPCILASRRTALGLIAASCVLTSWAQAPAMPEKTVLVSLSKASEPFMQRVRAEAENAALQLNLQLVFDDGKGESEIQVAGLEAAIASGRIDAVLIAPNNVSALAPAVDAAMQRGLPVVTMDRRVIGTRQPVPHIGADNQLGGQILAQWVVQQLPNGAAVPHLTGQSGSSSAIDRAKGVRDALAAAGPTYRLVGDVSANWSRAEALTATEAQLNFLKTPPDAIIAGNDDMAMGALEAIRLAGLERRGIRVIGYDALPFALEKVRSGELGATVDQRIEPMGRIALTRIAAFLRNGTPIQSESLTPVLVTAETLKVEEAASKARP